jgi:hypothetical protein
VSESNKGTSFEPPQTLTTLRGILAVGPLLLAVTSAAAYTIAFAYETGYADHFGYPHWMIDVTWIGVLVAWGGITSASWILFQIFMVTTQFVPARAAKALIANQTTLLIVACVVMMVVASRLISVEVINKAGHVGLWVGVVFLLIMGFALMTTLLDYSSAYREVSRAGGSWVERLEGTNKLIASREAGSGPLIKDSVALRALRHNLIGKTIGLVFTFFLLAAVVTLPAWALGNWNANRESSFLATRDSVDWVAVRRYGDCILAMRLRRDQHTLSPQYVVFQMADPHHVWALRQIRPLRLQQAR